MSPALDAPSPSLPQRFTDERICAEHLIALRWPDGFACRCGSRRAARLSSRADTFECLDCGRQTSVMAGTMMHRSKLSLRQWFQAIHAFSDRGEGVSVAQLGRALGIGRSSASLLKRKSEPLVIKAQTGLLEDRVAIVDGEIQLRSGARCTVIAAREERSGHIRAAAVLADASSSAIETFLQASVMPGSVLLNHSLKYRSITNYQEEFVGYGSDRRSIDGLFAQIENILGQSGAELIEQLDQRLRIFVLQQNLGRGLRAVSFETLLRLIIAEAPMSYWEMRGRQNPRKGKPADRCSPRRRKTANGMRQDRPRKLSNADPTPEP